jgi:hypothetical protein
MALATPQSRTPIGHTRIEASRVGIIAAWIRLHAKPPVIVTVLLGIFFLIQSRVPLRTAVQIGADEGFELAKAMLCLKGYKLYSDVWCDHPPLHTWLIAQTVKLQRNAPSLRPSPPVGERENYSALGPRLVSVGFAALLLVSVFVMALHVARQRGVGVAQTSKSAVSRVSEPAGRQSSSALPTWKPAIQQVGKPALQPLWTAGLAVVLLLASPGFLELSSSCMMEIPALTPAVAALCVLLIGRGNKWHWREVAAGVLFGIALGMKLLGLVLLPLAALIIWLRCRPFSVVEQRFQPVHPDRQDACPTTTVAPSDAKRAKVRECSRSWLPRPLSHFLTFATVVAFTFVALDWLIDRGAFLKHFQQTWVSHFAPAVSFEYGSRSDHRFPPNLLLKNWDMTVPAALGIFFLLQGTLCGRRGKEAGQLSQSRKRPPPHVGGYHFGALALVPVAWLVLMLAVFATHTPWWSYYYIHLAIPLSWCAAVGIVSVCSVVAKKLRDSRQADWDRLKTFCSEGRVTRVPGFSAVLERLGTRVTRPSGVLQQAGSAVPLLLFALCAVVWMSARVYLQIAGIRNAPQTYYSLALKEIERFKPFTEWIYADNLTYSFHSGIPMPPQLAVVSLKRLWSGEITVAGVGDEVRKFKPGVIALRNDTRELPFQDLLDTEYRLVYHDAENRLYAHRSIANKPDQ